MEFTLHKPDSRYFIRSVSENGITVVDRLLTKPLLVSAERLVEDWPPRSMQELESGHIESILEFGAEVVLIGTGRSQAFLPPEMMAMFYQRGTGVEVMTTPAAGRTFNVLVNEGRSVVAALMPLTSE